MTDTVHTRSDLTRWNRAGLTKFDYVDGDAAVWLEELRLALMGLYMRGGDPALRKPDVWRDLWLDESDPDRLEDLNVEQLAARVMWERLAPVVPKATETRGQRSERLLKQYDANPDGDYTWEIMRAFARASHVLLGHQNAYANEGYLRTATQWDNLRRLAALVNYQPTPPASASALVALILKEGLGAAQVDAGLAMKFAPPDGGAPLIFETGEPLMAHPDFNGARLVGWDVNTRPITHAQAGLKWIYPEDTEVTTGAIVVFTDGLHGLAGTVSAVTADEDTETAAITVDTNNASITVQTGKAQLLTEAEDVRPGLARPKVDEYDLVVDDGAGFTKGDLVRLTATNVSEVVVIRNAQGNRLRIRINQVISGRVRLTPLSALSRDEDGFFKMGMQGTAKSQAQNTKLYYRDGNDNVRAMSDASKAGGTVNEMKTSERADIVLGYEFLPANSADEKAYVNAPDAKGVFARVAGHREIPETSGGALRRVTFEGKPPKALTEGSWMAARNEDGSNLIALRVVQVNTAVGEYDVIFHTSYADRPEASEFHGPMKAPLNPVGFDRNPERAIPGASRTIILEDISAEARGVLRPGREFILSDEFGDGSTDVQATLTEFLPVVTGLQITFEAAETVSHLIAGNLLVRLNATDITHGESKGPKTLGSGDGEMGEQVFTLQVRNIAHVPSTLSVSGVVPAMTVAVDGQAWDYRDYTDASAQGARAWSSSLGEDGYLRLHFRRRLATGTSNVSLINHRVGTGARGNLVTPLAINKPVKKHPFVEAVHQPFPTAGGADREPVSSLRTSAPSRLSANGRAVSLADFERLAAGHASIWRARAVERATASTLRDVDITVVPAGGAALTEKLKDDLNTLIKTYAIPGVRLSFKRFGAVKLNLGALIRADLTSYDKTDILAAARDVLINTFSLENRDFGQTVYIAEVLAALETVPGITTAQTTIFDHLDIGDDGDGDGAADDLEKPRMTVSRDGRIAAIYPQAHQVAYLDETGTHLQLDVKGEG